MLFSQIFELKFYSLSELVLAFNLSFVLQQGDLVGDISTNTKERK